MAIELSLDTVNEMAQEDYADIAIPLPSGEAAILVHPLRMSDENRKELMGYFKALEKDAEKDTKKDADEAGEDEAEDVDVVSQAQDLLRIIVDGSPDELFEALRDDATKYQAVVKFYFEAVNPGEA